MKFNKFVFVVIFMVLVSIVGAVAVSEAPFSVKYDLEDSFIGFTIINFREPFSPSNIVSETLNSRQVSVPEQREIAVNFRLSSPPSSSLKSIELAVGDKGDPLFANGGSCLLTYYIKSVESVDVFDYDVNSLSPCNGYITVSGAKWRETVDSTFNFEPDVQCSTIYAENPVVSSCEIQVRSLRNPSCPATYFPYSDWTRVQVSGPVVFDDSINDYVCRDESVVIPYTCYSDVCGGRNLLIKQMSAFFTKSNYNDPVKVIDDDNPIVVDDSPVVVDDLVDPVVDSGDGVVDVPESVVSFRDRVNLFFQRVKFWFNSLFK